MKKNQELTQNAFRTAEMLANESSLCHRDVPSNGTQNVGQGYRNWIEKPEKCVNPYLFRKIFTNRSCSQ